MQFLLDNARRIVVKMGSGILTSGIGKLDTNRIGKLAGQMAALRAKGLEVIIVSSGAIAMGMGRLGLRKRPVDLPTLQACAAIGQSILIQTWQEAFLPSGIVVAQMLFTREDLRSRKRHVAAKDTLEKVLQMGVIPIINENDSVSTEEIQFGENDVLSSLVAILTKADFLIILSTIEGLLDDNGKGPLIPVVEEITPEIEQLAGGTTSVTSVGGMRSKIEAAKLATRSGCGVFIGSGHDEEVLIHIFFARSKGTFFVPKRKTMQSRKRWIAFFEKSKGVIEIDSGACEAIVNGGKSLLAKGITGFQGTFQTGDIVDIIPSGGLPVARGLTEFSSVEMASIIGRGTEEIRGLFPDKKRREVIHRDSLVMLK